MRAGVQEEDEDDGLAALVRESEQCVLVEDAGLEERCLRAGPEWGVRVRLGQTQGGS